MVWASIVLVVGIIGLIDEDWRRSCSRVRAADIQECVPPGRARTQLPRTQRNFQRVNALERVREALQLEQISRNTSKGTGASDLTSQYDITHKSHSLANSEGSGY